MKLKLSSMALALLIASGAAYAEKGNQSVQSISGSSQRSISGSSMRGITGSGLRATNESETYGITGSGLRGITGSGLRGITGSGLRATEEGETQGITGSGMRSISGSSQRSISGSSQRSISGSSQRSISGSSQRSISGSSQRSISGSSQRSISGSSQRDFDVVAYGPITAVGPGVVYVLGQKFAVDRAYGAELVGQVVYVGGVNDGEALHAESVQFSGDFAVPGADTVWLAGVISSVNPAYGTIVIGDVQVDVNSIGSAQFAPGDRVTVVGTQPALGGVVIADLVAELADQSTLSAANTDLSSLTLAQ